MRLTLLAMSVIGALATAGCEQSPVDRSLTSPPAAKVSFDDVRQDAGKSLQTTAIYSQQTKDKFMKDLQSQLAAMDANIAKLRVKGANLASDAKANWDAKMADLEIKRQAANARMVEIGSATADAWADVQQGAISAWSDLEQAFQDASKEF